MSMLLKGNTTFSPHVCIIIVTHLLMTSACLINDDVSASLGTSTGILIVVAFLLYFLYSLFAGGYSTANKDYVIVEEKEILIIIFILGWALSVFMWTYNLFKKQKDVSISDSIDNETNDNDDLIGGWYGTDSKLSCWLPVLAFEKNYIATFSDGNYSAIISHELFL